MSVAVPRAGAFEGTKDVGGAGWLRIGLLQAGDILLVSTEHTEYYFFITGDSHAIIFSDKLEVKEVVLLGSSADGGANWGSVQCGCGLLFRDLGEDGTATQTSLVKSVRIRSKRGGVGGAPQQPSLPRHPQPMAIAKPRVAVPRAKV